jgi:ubiquinone/menaquinone biosynthesis C-methylase UbiE
VNGRRLTLLAGAALAAETLRQRRDPSPCPYSLRFLLWFPRPFIGRGALLELLEPRAGERVLELGPGTGVHAAFAVADALRPGGTLAALDAQREMIEALERGARERGADNIEACTGDATALPYENESFDAAYLVTVLGEVPDQAAALAELHRVLKPGGRVVFGETVLDPHLVTFGALRERCEQAGLRFDARTGVPGIGYLARFLR